MPAKDENSDVKVSENMMLSSKDRDVFIEALLNPPEPNEALHKATQEHRKVLG